MGFDVERFITPINDGLLCCICRDVLEDPLQGPCEHAYCTSCIRGWLVHEHKCPEDRQPLSFEELRPLFRYMKNDLTSLQVKCRNHAAGCSMVCRLEQLKSHEGQCDFHSQECPSVGCTQWLSRTELDDHLKVCDFITKECPRGCGLPILSKEDATHNCISELRTSLELLHSEMLFKLQEQKQELELRLDSQRRYMVQRESVVRAQFEEVKSQILSLSQEVLCLKSSEAQRQLELERAELEKQELLDVITALQRGTEGTAGKRNTTTRASRAMCRQCSTRSEP